MYESEDALAQLKSRVVQAVELVDGLQTENRDLKEEIQKLRKDLEGAKEDKSTKNRLIKQLKSDRLKIRSRVEKILQKVDALEESQEL
mgnify:FL=1